MRYALELDRLEVRFDRFALGPITLELDPGRVVGLIGPNGSGKTTTIRCIAGNLFPDAGSIRVCDVDAGHQSGSWKEPIGYVPDTPVFYEWMNGHRFLEFLGGFYPTWSQSFAGELVRRFRLDLDAKVRHLSKGNRLKLSLVAALAHHPRLALFDEPTAGLDPVVRTEVFDVLGEMMEGEDMTIVYSTHIVDDLHRLADELIFLREGQVQLRAPKDDLIDRWRRIRFRCAGELPRLSGVQAHDRHGDVHEVVTPDGGLTLEELRVGEAETIDEQILTLEEVAVCIMREV